MHETSKDIQIGEHKYQIKKLDARTASWISMQLVTKVLPSIIGAKEVTPGLPPAPRAEMSESEFHGIQDHCLNVCYRYGMVGTQMVAQPIMMNVGVFAFKDLEFDVITVMNLTVQALIFSVSPFFAEGGLQSLVEQLPGRQQTTPPLT